MSARAGKYAGAIAIALAAVALRWALIPLLGWDTPFATVIGATAIAVWMGGWGPAVVAAVVGLIGTSLVIGRPLGSLPTDRVHTVIGLILYVSTCALIIGLGEGMRRSRDAYRRAQERFLRSQEAAIQGYGLLKTVRGPDGTVTDFELEYINPLGASICQSAPQSLMGRPITTVLPGSCAAGLFGALREVVLTGAPVDIELADAGSAPPVWLRFMIVKVEDGAAMSFSDITQTKQLALSLKQRAADLHRANAIKSVFLATLSHELRNPLAPIRNGIAILKARMPEGADEVHDMMERQMQLATRLIDDLLDASRVDRGRLELHRETISLESLVAAAIETARPNIESKSLQLQLHEAPRSLYVDGDPTRLAQVVANLLNNAAKFTPANGRIEVWMRGKADHAVIRIRDSGVGIAREDLGRIFEMFVQLDSCGSQAAAGLGLGLPLARELARLHGGDVTAHSAGPGKGSEFRIRLPLVAAPALPFEANRVTPVTDTPRQVLIVDDNVDAATSLSTLLRYRGHSVHTCFDGSAAFAAAARSPPDVAFIDLNMPRPDGAELAVMIRGQPWGASVKLVALTGMGQPADLERTRVAGFDEHLTKPARPDDLFRAIATQRHSSAEAGGTNAHVRTIMTQTDHPVPDL
jgi:signal transduction histidine kinase/ActR/RegA family two-component response regulator